MLKYHEVKKKKNNKHQILDFLEFKEFKERKFSDKIYCHLKFDILSD